MDKPFSKITPKEMLDKQIATYTDGYIPQTHSGFFDLGQAVASVLMDEILEAKGYWGREDIISFTFEHEYVEGEDYMLKVNVSFTIVDDPEDENTTTHDSDITSFFTKEEVEPLMKELLSRWEEFLYASAKTATK